MSMVNPLNFRKMEAPRRPKAWGTREEQGARLVKRLCEKQSDLQVPLQPPFSLPPPPSRLEPTGPHLTLPGPQAPRRVPSLLVSASSLHGNGTESQHHQASGNCLCSRKKKTKMNKRKKERNQMKERKKSAELQGTDQLCGA